MPLLKAEPRVTSDIVLAALEEAEIWYAYFGPFELKQRIPSVFRKDENPSTGFYISKTGRIIYSDLATSEKLDCFAFVAKKFGISYGEAVKLVACEFGIIECGMKKFSKGMLSKAQIQSVSIKKETDIEFVPDKWTEENLAFWSKIYIDADELQDEDVFVAKEIYINGKLVPNYKKDFRYVYVINVKGKSYKKIYTPYANKKDFKWISNIPLHIPFGINKLPKAGKTLVIAKAQKDRILFRKFIPDVIGLQNESPAALNARTRKYIADNYERVFICLDPDPAGLNATEFFSGFGYIPLFIPEKAQAKGLKDFANFVEGYGLNWFEKYLKLKEVI